MEAGKAVAHDCAHEVQLRTSEAQQVSPKRVRATLKIAETMHTDRQNSKYENKEFTFSLFFPSHGFQSDLRKETY